MYTYACSPTLISSYNKMNALCAISPIDHHRLVIKALVIKIEKLERWLHLYRNGKIQTQSSRYVIEYMVMLADTQRELQTLLNNK